MPLIEETLKGILADAFRSGFDVCVEPEQIALEVPKRKEQGDLSSNAAMQFARVLKKSPRQIAEVLLNHMDLEGTMVETAEIAGPGFLNFRLKKDSFSSILHKILEEKEKYGQLPENHMKVNLEYVSANPTGSLHLGHARGAAWGDSTARIMKKAGYDVTREYYVNDAGNQIANLAQSLWARYQQALGNEAEIGADGYLGEDIRQMGERLAEQYGDAYPVFDEETRKQFARFGIDFELAKIQDDLDLFRVHFDVWSSEQAIRDAGKIEIVLDQINSSGYLYEQDGALWFQSSAFDDDKDRVLKKTDGSYTYLVPDIAYHNDKYERGYDLLVDFLGADHHGYIKRLKGTMQALGNDPDKLNVDIIQMVRLVEDGEEMKMSKRLGNATTIRELVEAVGADAARYFFVSRALDSHLDFDVKLAATKSQENPVYYAQYAHARMCSILRQAQETEIAGHFEGLVHEKEMDLLKTLQDFEKVIAESARTRQVHKMVHYIQTLASRFHSFYNACKVIDADNPALTGQRLALVLASRITLANALDLIGVSAPETM